MTETRRKTFDRTALGILAVLFIAVTLFSNALLGGLRVDLTEDKLYTISEGTRNILGKIGEPVNLYFFFSDRATEDLQQIRMHAARVRETLEEFAAESGNKINLQVIDPLPFSEEEDRASGFGLDAASAGAGRDGIYFGLAGTNSVGDTEIIPFFEREKETFLEYDLARLIHTLSNPKKPVIGLLSTLPMDRRFDQEARRMINPWVITSQIGQLFEVRQLDAATPIFHSDIDVLMLVHPKNLGTDTLYAIDQFILSGGKALLFIDPNAEADVPDADPSNPYAAMSATRTSQPGPMLNGWGVRLDLTRVVADRQLAISVTTQMGGRPVPHYGFLGLTAEQLNDTDVVSAALNSINIATPGAIDIVEDSGLTVEPLLHSSQDSSLMESEQFRFLPDPAALFNSFTPDDKTHIIAVRITGPATTAFPNGRPGSGAQDPESDDETTADTISTEHLSESDGPINVILVADTDLLSDRFWVQELPSMFGQRLHSAFANNGDFVINALENLTGSSDLISIRGRASYSRPFSRVQQLEREADERFRLKEQELQSELAETERKLGDLQSSREDDNLLLLSDEQRAEIDRFQQEKLRIRKELRQVRRSLDEDIERLGLVLKVVNIALVPFLITLLALATVVIRRRQRARA